MKRILPLAAVLLLSSCQLISSFLHDGDVVARAGKEKLYRAEVEAVIPNGISVEDSTKLSAQYIQSWVQDRLFVQVAGKELSKAERDVSRELEDYRRSLLKYRYEQAYVNQRLDTTITQDQYKSYYEAHLDRFGLETAIVKARFMNISPESPNFTVIRKKMSSSKSEDLVEADSLAYTSAMRYTDFGNAWIPAPTLSREFGMDASAFLSALKDGFIEREDGHGGVNIAYVSERMKAGETAPLDYCRPRIKDIILSSRKKALLTGLESDLMRQAEARKEYEIY